MNDIDLAPLDLWWRAANYLSVGQIYLRANPLLREPLTIDTSSTTAWTLGHHARLEFIYAHLNRIIRARDQNMIYVCGPGHGGPGMVANTWLEGSYSEMVSASAATASEWSACSGSSPPRRDSQPRRS